MFNPLGWVVGFNCTEAFSGMKVADSAFALVGSEVCFVMLASNSGMLRQHGTMRDVWLAVAPYDLITYKWASDASWCGDRINLYIASGSTFCGSTPFSFS